MKLPQITETTTESFQEVSKSQLIRVLDVLAIGPAMVAVGYKFKAKSDLDEILKLSLIAFGWATVYYNAKNWHTNYQRYKKML